MVSGDQTVRPLTESVNPWNRFFFRRSSPRSHTRVGRWCVANEAATLINLPSAKCQPAAGQLWRRGLRFRLTNLPGWTSEGGLYCSPVWSSQVAADRLLGGAAGHGEGGARATRSRWALLAHGRAGPARDFYLYPSVDDILIRVCVCAVIQGVWSAPRSQVGGGHRVPWDIPYRLVQPD